MGGKGGSKGSYLWAIHLFCQGAQLQWRAARFLLIQSFRRQYHAHQLTTNMMPDIVQSWLLWLPCAPILKYTCISIVMTINSITVLHSILRLNDKLCR